MNIRLPEVEYITTAADSSSVSNEQRSNPNAAPEHVQRLGYDKEFMGRHLVAVRSQRASLLPAKIAPGPLQMQNILGHA